MRLPSLLPVAGAAVIALLAVGLGYLGTTGALHEIGAMVWSEAEMIEQGR